MSRPVTEVPASVLEAVRADAIAHTMTPLMRAMTRAEFYLRDAEETITRLRDSREDGALTCESLWDTQGEAVGLDIAGCLRNARHVFFRAGAQIPSQVESWISALEAELASAKRESFL